MKFIKLFLVSWLLLFAVNQVNAQRTPIKFQEYDLKNGLHVILHQDNSTPIVAVSVMYHVGSKNEDPKRTGFAHFFEHLMFEGSEYIDRGQYFKIVQNAGGQLNANTSWDRTFYYEVLPSNQLELGLWMEAERMLHLKVDSIGVETQRKVVKEERSMRLDNKPYGSILEQVFSHAYHVHPYRWTPIGSAQYIDQATLAEFLDFYRTYYVPNNAILSIAGDIDIEATKKLVAKYYGDIPKGTKPMRRPTEVEPQQTKEVIDTVYDNIQLPAMIYAYHMPAQGTTDYYALSVLTTLLSGGNSSRLVKELVDKQEVALMVNTFPLALEDPGLFMMMSFPNFGGDVKVLQTKIDSALDAVKTGEISDFELQKVKNSIESDFVKDNSTMRGIAESLANYKMYFGDANLINTELDRYMKVTKEDLKRVANQYLVNTNRVVLYYLPKNSK